MCSPAPSIGRYTWAGLPQSHPYADCTIQVDDEVNLAWRGGGGVVHTFCAWPWCWHYPCCTLISRKATTARYPQCPSPRNRGGEGRMHRQIFQLRNFFDAIISSLRSSNSIAALSIAYSHHHHADNFH